MSDKVIFLDLDGVLVTARSHAALTRRYFMRHFDPIAVRLVGRLCEEFDAKLVLSSTWRQEFDREAMTCILLQAGLSEVPWHQCWKTPAVFSGVRGLEIEQWHHTNQGHSVYVILDDGADMLPDQLHAFVQTDSYDGLSYRQWEKARAILKKPIRATDPSDTQRPNTP